MAAKVLADNTTSLMCAAGAEHATLPTRSRKYNRSYAATFIQRVQPRLVLLLGSMIAAIVDAVAMLGANSQRIVHGRSRPRKPNQAKPHPSCSHKA